MKAMLKETKHKSVKQKKVNSDRITLLIMFMPAFILLVVFRYIPLYGNLIAFKDYHMLEGIIGSPFVGLDVFKRLFANDFLHIFKNTLVISLLKLLFGFPAPIILALLLNEVKPLGYKKAVQTVSYLPYFFSWIVLAGIIRMLFSYDGAVNVIGSFFGLPKLTFFMNGGLFITMIIITAVWQGCGWGSVIYIASLSSIDASLYEAATIDGAGRWKQMLHVSLPSLVPTIITVFILNLGGVLNAGVDQIYNLYNPMVYDVADILDTYVLRTMDTMDYSIGTAAGFFKSVICFGLVVLSNYTINKMSGGEQGIW